MNNNRRQVYVDNYNLLTNLEIALSIPNIEPLESDNDYEILENFEECAMIISELIHIIKRSTYIESFVYNELKKLSGKVYNARWVLERAIRDHAMQIDKERVKVASLQLKTFLQYIQNAESKEQLRGYEGEAASIYFSVFDELILQQKKDFSFHEVDSTHDLLEMLFGDIKNSFDTALDDNKDNFKNYLSSLNSIHENNNSSTLNYIDSYFYNSIINNINFSSNETSDFKSITISSNDSFGNSLVSFLNSNNLNILANTFFAQFDKLKEYNLNIDFSSLSFTFEISQELEYKLLNNLSLNINFKDTEKLYSLFLNIDKISEMNSSSEFVENKYVFLKK